MRRQRVLPLLVLAALAPACANTLNTSIHANPKADFSTYKTFQIKGSRLQTENEALLNQEITKRLEAKGLKPVDQNPDLVVDPQLVRNAAEVPEPTYDTSWWTGSASAEPTGTMPIGALVVSIMDPKTNQMVWRGVAEGTVPPGGGLARQKAQIALDRLFADFPPKPASH
jgi:hypothetical protein